MIAGDAVHVAENDGRGVPLGGGLLENAERWRESFKTVNHSLGNANTGAFFGPELLGLSEFGAIKGGYSGRISWRMPVPVSSSAIAPLISESVRWPVISGSTSKRPSTTISARVGIAVGRS